MRPLYFLFPHLKTDVGGNIAQFKLQAACGSFTNACTITYGTRVDGYSFLDDILAASGEGANKPIFVVHWVPDVARLVERLEGRDVVYIAHSTGWNSKLPATVPILCVSRNSQAFWGRYAPNSFIRYIPNIVVPKAGPAVAVERDIDVLVQKRKSSDYLMHQLIPALAPHCNLVVLDGWVEDLGTYFQRSKVYLYDSVDHWIAKNATEGFGLPPMEAMAAGCVVFSSINDALSDFLDPGYNCMKIGTYSTAYDVEAVLIAVKEGRPRQENSSFFQQLSEAEVSTRLRAAFSEIESFFVHARTHRSDIHRPILMPPPASLSRRLKKSVKALLRD